MQLETHLAAPLAALIAAFALCGWALWSYRRTLSPVSAGRRRLLLALRLAASLLLALMLGGLDLVLERRHAEPPLLRVLVDASASMQRPAAAGNVEPSRYTRARALLAELEARYGKRLRLAPAAFGDGLVAGELPAEATAPVTDLGAALAALPPAEPGEALLLLSDGCDTEGGLWAGALRGGRPVHGLVLGDSVAPADLRLDEVEALPVLRKGARLPLAAEIAVTGAAPRHGRLAIREDGRLLAERDWLVEPGETRTRVEFSLAVEGVGQHLLELTLEPEGTDGAPDAAPGNDRRLLPVRVVESRLRVLVLAGRPDFDLAALLDGLRGDEALELVAVTPGPAGGLREAASGKAWPVDAEEWHGLVLHSWLPGWDPGLLERLRLRGGVLLLGGFLEHPGGARLPARWHLDLASGPASAAGEGFEQRLHWGEDAARHPAVQGAVALGTDPASLPALESVSPNPLAGARELLASPAGPLLVARELGGQRLVACSGRGFWRWPLHGEQGGPLYGELFSGLLRWLAREDPPERLLVEWGEEPLSAGQPGRLHAEVFDPDFRSLSEAELDWSLSRAGGDSLLAAGAFARETAGEGFTTPLPALPEGIYRLDLNARLASGEQLARSLELPVQAPRRELMDLAARPETLRWLAAQTGGLVLEGGRLEDLDAALNFTPRVTMSRQILRLWQHPLTFLLLLSLLGIEWGLRKRLGMV